MLLFPAFDGCVIDDPRAVFRRGRGSLEQTYPGALSCQVMAFCDPVAGLYLASHDPDGYAKAFAIEGGFQTRLSIAHLGPQVPGEDLRPTYPIVLGPFQGDPRRGGTSWYDAAAIYRDWSQKQKWAELRVPHPTRYARLAPRWLAGYHLQPAADHPARRSVAAGSFS